MTQTALSQFVCAEVQVVSDLVAIDLVGRNVVRNNVDTDVVGASDRTLAKEWSVAFHEHLTTWTAWSTTATSRQDLSCGL
jgi:hypothetical protein